MLQDDILSLQTGPEFEAFIKAGVTALSMEISPSDWEMAAAETAAGLAVPASIDTPGVTLAVSS